MNKCISFLAVSVLLAGCSTENPRDLVRRAGYLTTVPPTTGYGPGNIVWKKKNRYISSEDVSLGYICSPGYVKFPGNPEQSSSEILDFAGKKDFSFSADNLKNLGLGLTAQYTSNLTLKFSNIEYQEYALDKIDDIERNLGKECRNILKKQRDKRNAYAVRAAFKADLDYKITYKATATANIKAKIVKEIQAEFGLTAENSEGRVGRGLFYGVDLEPLY